MTSYIDGGSFTNTVGHLTFLVLDIGTSSLKGAIMTDRGEVLSSVHHRIMGPSERAADFQAHRWTDALRRSVPHLVAGYTIDAVVLSGNGPTVVPIGRDGLPVGAPLLWLDGRSESIPGSSSFYLGKIAWFQRNSPAAREVWKYLPFPEYLIYWLTGEAVATTPGDEFSRFIWSQADVERAESPSELLPPFVSIGEVVGQVRALVGEELGVSPGVPVIAAGSDFLMSLVGTNTLRPGETCDRAGTSEGINYCSAVPIDQPALRTLPHVIPGRYNVAGILSSTGLLFEWFREISGQKNRDYGDMMLDILSVSDTADIPWFFPSVHRGAAWEFQRGMFIGLGAEHDSAALGRAVVLSIGFAVREAVDILRASACQVTRLNACGGQAKNGLWTQMKANIVGVPIEVPAVADAELTGDLCAGMVGIGAASSLEEAADRVVHMVHTFEPDPSRTALFIEQYERYRDRYQRFRQALEECE
ncbi:MAG: xylulokinase [Alkalispirochaeta sp.]